MKILLHGAISGTNFGDCLFAGMFYDNLIKQFGKENIYFFDIPPFGIGNHVKEGLQYRRKLMLSDYRNIDALVYISGGYFGDGNKSIKASIIRYFRYLLLGLFAINRKINIYVIGLEVGPIHHKFVRNAVKKILTKSKMVIVRNEDSLKYTEKLSVQNVICSADTAISISEGDYCGKESDSTIELLKQINKKIIFLHMLPFDTVDISFIGKIIRPLIEFIKKHEDYCVVYGTDGGKKENSFEPLVSCFKDNNIVLYKHKYTNWYDMCYFLSKVNIIVTRKLHVGIIGARFGKSVISTPMHLYKTMRFYKQIGEAGRCVQYDKLTNETLYTLLDEYAEKNITIPESVIAQANQNIELLIKALNESEEI